MSMIDFNTPLILPGFVASGDLTASGSFYLFGTTAPGPGARGYGSVVLSWQWAGTSTPNGTWQIDGNNQTGAATGETWYTIYLDANKAYGFVNNAVYAHAGGNTIAVNSAVAGYLMCVLDKIPPYLRITWTRTGGGAATGFTAAQATFRPV